MTESWSGEAVNRCTATELAEVKPNTATGVNVHATAASEGDCEAQVRIYTSHRSTCPVHLPKAFSSG